jgi:23S rRNA (pseudouridine1915-N3)-methyltransferase
MNIKIFAIGNLKNSEEQTMIDEYLKRCGWKIDIISYVSKEKDEARLKQDEAKLLLGKARKSSLKIVLDENGKNLTSVEFAKLFANSANNGISEIDFFIGGASGHDKNITERADQVVSLSKMTFPHSLARLLLIEQIYRSWTIINNKSYHK